MSEPYKLIREDLDVLEYFFKIQYLRGPSDPGNDSYFDALAGAIMRKSDCLRNNAKSYSGEGSDTVLVKLIQRVFAMREQYKEWETVLIELNGVLPLLYDLVAPAKDIPPRKRPRSGA